MFETILVGAVSGAGDGALEAAAELASAQDAELVVMNLDPQVDARAVFDSEGAPPPVDATAELRDRYPSLRVRACSGRGGSVGRVRRVAGRARADLVVMPRTCRASRRIVRAPHAPRLASVPGEVLADFYAQPLARTALGVCTVLLSFGGGAVMFWVHAVWRREPGPPIANVYHCLLDTTLGSLALTPVLALLLPLGILAAGRTRWRLGGFVLTLAAGFTLLTGPGPFLHNELAGAGTPVARMATHLFGHDAAVATRAGDTHECSSVTEGLVQIAIGLPVYTLLTWFGLACVRRRRRRQQRRGAAARGAAAAGSPLEPAVLLTGGVLVTASDPGEPHATVRGGGGSRRSPAPGGDDLQRTND